MERLWHHPLLYAGLVLFALGVGNFAVSQSKVREYETRRKTEHAAESRPLLSDFPELTPQTSMPLWKHLQRGQKDASLASAKLDFYSVVNFGGRILVAAGAVLILTVLAWNWRHVALRTEATSR